ncbi:cysteine--tRNA ligase [bacterium]|nr:cysteine--tRNA ligase [bacterium]
MLVFTNTETRSKQPFKPLADSDVKLYTCGPTVYNFAHIGNFRAIVAYDLLKRWLAARGFRVNHVMNITDVDDKTIRGARAAGIPLSAFTARYTAAFFDDCAALRILKPDITPAATAHIPQMIALVRTLVDKEFAYVAGDGSVYFAIGKFPAYGRLSHLDRGGLRDGARVAQDEYDKDNVCDFVLWKAWTEDDGGVKWDSPWGPGRPGWHLECSVMAREYLGDTLDVHMGGEDLVFPHHENEIAQSEAATGKPFVRFWLHNAYLQVDGRKMSKSLGNFHTLRDILARGYTGREVRYLLLSAHYRQPLNFTFTGLHAARSALQRLDDLRANLARAASAAGEARPEAQAAVDAARAAWTAALDDDLNTSAALAALFDLVRQANVWLQDGAMQGGDARAVLAFMDEADKVLAVAGADDAAPEEVTRLAAERAEARAAKNWARADEVRKKLAELGFTVEDTPAGPRVKRL